MRRLLRLYRSLIRISMLSMLQYRASNMIWMIGSFVEPLIYLIVWSTVAESRGGEVGGFSVRQFAAYYTVFFVVNHLTFAWIMHVFQYRVQMGSLSFELLRPVHPIHADISDNLAYKVHMSVVVAPAVLFLALVFDPDLEFEWVRLGLFLPALLLGLALRFTMEWTLALAVFWTPRVTAINQIYFVVLMFMSGRIAPIALLPGVLATIAWSLPFYYCVAFPVEIALGRLSMQQVLAGYGVQVVWLLAALAMISLVWRVAVRRFTAVGS